MITKENIQNIKNQIAQGDIDLALEQLSKALKGSTRLNEVILFSGRLANLNKQVRMGVISQSQAMLTNNQINAGLIDLLNQLEKDNPASNP